MSQLKGRDSTTHDLAPPLIDTIYKGSGRNSSIVTSINDLPTTTLSTAEIDLVIVFSPSETLAPSLSTLRDLLQAIQEVGLELQIREGAVQGDVLIFIGCPQKRLRRAVHSARSKDWLSGVRVAVPEYTEQSIEHVPVKDSERLQLIFDILTAPKSEQGAAITPNFGRWKNVKSVFPIHDQQFDNAWLKRWSTKWTIDDDELEHLCEHFGTKIAMYFAFLQFYLISLAIPATLGVFAFFLLPEYSVIYSCGISLWAICFSSLWERRQGQLAFRWDVRNCSKVEHERAAHRASESGIAATSKRDSALYGGLRRLTRESLVVPFTLLAGSVLAVVLTAIFAIEVFLGEVYEGPFKSILTFTPTVLFSVLVGPFSSLYMKLAKQLTVFEDHETDAHFNAAITRKSFVLNFMTSYTSLFLTLFVYQPFGHIIVPKLDIFGITSTYAAYGVTAKPFVLDNSRIRNQLFYFAVTAQVVNLFQESILPFILRLVKGEAQQLQAKITGNGIYKPRDRADEVRFLERVRYESELAEYDTYTDYAELVVQFGHTVMFSPIWPLTPLCAVLNNIVELRADAAKLCRNVRRPVPMRADSIGPWADNLVLLTWLGSLTTASITYLLRGDATSKPFLHMLAVSLFAEHGYLLARKCVNLIISRVPNATTAKISQEEMRVREKYLSKLTNVDIIPNGTSQQPSQNSKNDIEALWQQSSQIVTSKFSQKNKTLSNKRKEL